MLNALLFITIFAQIGYRVRVCKMLPCYAHVSVHVCFLKEGVLVMLIFNIIITTVHKPARVIGFQIMTPKIYATLPFRIVSLPFGNFAASLTLRMAIGD